MNNKYLEKLASKRIGRIIRNFKAEDILETGSDVKSVLETGNKVHQYLNQTYGMKEKKPKKTAKATK